MSASWILSIHILDMPSTLGVQQNSVDDETLNSSSSACIHQLYTQLIDKFYIWSTFNIYNQLPDLMKSKMN